MDRKKQKLYIKKTMNDLGLKTQAELAELIGVSTQTIRQWSAGNVFIPSWFFKFIDCIKESRAKN